MAPHSSNSCLENPMDGGAWQATVQWVAKIWTLLNNFTFTFQAMVALFTVVQTDEVIFFPPRIISSKILWKYYLWFTDLACKLYL